jgi:hypothetical protein
MTSTWEYPGGRLPAQVCSRMRFSARADPLPAVLLPMVRTLDSLHSILSSLSFKINEDAAPDSDVLETCRLRTVNGLVQISQSAAK